MSALARWFKYKGCEVYGYDLTPTKLTDQLQAEGIDIHFEDTVAAIPQKVLVDKSEVLVVYTPAIPKNHRGFAYFNAKGYTIKKRSQVLGMLTQNRFTVAVAGTHGKTTTSTMIAHILNYSGKNCDAFLGGISNNIGTNLLVSDKATEDSVMVVEADEYDRSFLTLQPNIAVVTAADADHLDIYGDENSLKESFGAFINRLTSNGILVLKEGLSPLRPTARNDIRVFNYAIHDSETRAENILIEKDIFKFDYISASEIIENIRLKVPGYHNVENAIAASTVALQLGVSTTKIREALEIFSGVKRRFEYILRKDDLVYIDDYAHHPVEIEAFLKSVRAIYPGRKLTVVFQPHLFSRTRDFMQDFSRTLSRADEVLLLDIYPARELPIPGVSSQQLLEEINAKEKGLLGKEELIAFLKKNRPEILVTIGAGDIDKLVEPIKAVLVERYELEGN